MRTRHLSAITVLLAGATLFACSGADRSGFGDGPGGNGSKASGGSSGGGTTSSGGDSGGPGMFGGSSGSSGSGGGSGGGEAGAVGPVDQTPPCDSSLAVDGDAASFAKAMGICTQAAQGGWGLVSASYSSAYGSTTAPASGQWGLLPKFGILAPREGSALGALSSGYAREYDDAAGVDQGMTSAFVAGQPMDGTSYPTGQAPAGFPKAAQGCPQDNLVNDMIDVKLVIKAPPDATGFQFDFAFFSSEWPNYVCSNFNDAFVAYLASSQTHDNISFDSVNNPVAVNIGFLDVCTQGAPIGCLRSNGAQPAAVDLDLRERRRGAQRDGIRQHRSDAVRSEREQRDRHAGCLDRLADHQGPHPARRAVHPGLHDLGRGRWIARFERADRSFPVDRRSAGHDGHGALAGTVKSGSRDTRSCGPSPESCGKLGM